MKTTNWARAALALTVVLTSCEDFPKDPEDTFKRVRETGEIRIAMIEERPWAYEQKEGSRAGLEVELAEKFAESIPAQPQWQFASEAEAVRKLERLEVDLVVGGLTKSSPRSKTVGFTRPYLKTPSPHKEKTAKHVFAVPRGENRWMVELEKFLHERRSSIREAYERTQP